MQDFDDIDVTDADAIDVQITERHAVIDRLHGEIAALEGHGRRIKQPHSRSEDE